MSIVEQVLDHGYVEYIEAWGRGKAQEFIDTRPDFECGIIEAARQSTQGAFRAWAPYEACEKCGNWRFVNSDIHRGAWSDCEHVWKKFPKGDKGLHQFLFTAKPQHATPFEFAGCIIEVQAPIFVFREWHRHRTQSYNEMSARYAPLPPNDYMPDMENMLVRAEVARVSKNRQAQGAAGEGVVLSGDEAMRWLGRLQQVYNLVEDVYQDGLRIGVPKELARCSMVVARYSRMRASANLRNWLAFLTLREDEGAQWEIRQFAHAVGRVIKLCFPKTWELFDLGRVK